MSSRHDETIEMTRERIELQPSVLPLSQEEFNRRARSFFRFRVLSLKVAVMLRKHKKKYVSEFD